MSLYLGYLLPLVLALGIGLNGLRLRGRLRGVGVLEPAEAPADPRHRFVTAAGVELDEATRRAASAFAAREGLEVVDLIPADLPAYPVLDLARLVEVAAFRHDRLAVGRSARHAMLVDASVLARARIEQLDVLDPVGFAELAVQLKRYAPDSTSHAVAAGLHAGPEDMAKRLALLQALHSAGTPLALALPAVGYAAMVISLLVNPAWGLAAAALFCAQPYLVVAGVPLAPRDLHRAALLRPVLDPLRWVRTLAGRWRPPARPDPYEQRRPEYAADLAAGTERFFEPRRDTCPWCGSTRLSRRLVTGDLIQRKPGRFTLESCKDCRHIFQNPRLTLAGLDFYYRDFYDGLGEAQSEFLFSGNGQPYRQRAEMVKPFTIPGKWLDVGAGHGHFCSVARGVWPDAVFDGLDMSESIEEAERRRWVTTGYRGLFPDLAPELAGRYDVVSMHHYLEHTREPFAELDAAATALRPGGFLLIEVPNPESRYGRLLGRLWLPWFQPQHQHFVPLGNLRDALADRGFTEVAVEHGRANQPVDLTGALALLLNACVPDPRLPWRGGTPTRGRRLGHGAAVTAALPLLLGALVVDALVGQVLRRTRGGNTYRVLARLDSSLPARPGLLDG
jgi:SAM-dependent methyltransferase